MSETPETRPVGEPESLKQANGEGPFQSLAEELALGFVGNPQAKIDERGRLKLPSEFRSFVEKKYGESFKAFYVTSTDGKTGELYPLPEWHAHMAKVLAMPRMHPSRVKLLANYTRFGDKVEMDPQGRMQLPEKLRVEADLNGDVKVSGEGVLLRITSVKRLDEAAQTDALNATDFAALADYGL
jgi:MraZ protein